MEVISSPLTNGDMARYRWYYVLLMPRWQRYVTSLQSQCEKRGEVPANAWLGGERYEVARQIEGILGEVCWGVTLSFHPDDPFSVVGEWEIGDMSEVHALMNIERRFAVEISDEELQQLVADGTFGDFVDMVQRKRNAAEIRGS